MKKIVIATLMAGLCIGASGPASGMGSTQERPTLLVMPSRYTSLQLAFDLIEKRDMVLVSYQSESGGQAPVLHVWDRQEWIPISMDAFRGLTFLRTSPSRIVLVGDDATLPASLVEASTATGSGKVMQIPAQDTATVVNSLGKVFNFSNKEWAWFSGRYRLDLTDANAEMRSHSFYDQPIVGRPESPWKRPVGQSRHSSSSRIQSSTSTATTIDSRGSYSQGIAPLGTLSVAPIEDSVIPAGGMRFEGSSGSSAPVIWVDDAPIK